MKTSLTGGGDDGNDDDDYDNKVHTHTHANTNTHTQIYMYTHKLCIVKVFKGLVRRYARSSTLLIDACLNRNLCTVIIPHNQGLDFHRFLLNPELKVAFSTDSFRLE